MMHKPWKWGKSDRNWQYSQILSTHENRKIVVDLGIFRKTVEHTQFMQNMPICRELWKNL